MLELLTSFWESTGFSMIFEMMPLELFGLQLMLPGHLIMIIIACIFLYLAIWKGYEPYLLIPIAFGMLLVNLPLAGLMEEGGLLRLLYTGTELGIYPPLIFLCIGASTDFGPLIANPKSLLLGAAAQLGIFFTFIGAILLGFTGPEAASIGIIGGADGPTAFNRKTSAASAGFHCHCRLFLYGVGADHSASDYEAADNQRRTANQNGTAAAGIQNGKNPVPDCRHDFYSIAAAISWCVDRYADAGQFNQGIWCRSVFNRCDLQFIDVYRQYSSRSDGWGKGRCFTFP